MRKFFLSKVRNELGISLVQVLISMGILSGLFVAAMKLIKQQTQLGESSSYRFEALMVTDEIKSFLSDPASCRATLSGKSGIFDYVSEIRSFDPAFKETVQVYADTKLSSKPLGQKDLFLQQMTINGSAKAFNTEVGYTTLTLSFSDKLNGGNLFQTMFLLKVNLSDLGRINGCQATPGLHQEKSARTLKDPWQKISDSSDTKGTVDKTKKKKVDANLLGVAYTEGPVVLGKAPAMGQLNVEGGVLLMEFGNPTTKPCGPEQLGVLSYGGRDQRLYFCSQYGEWRPLNGDQTLFTTSKSFLLRTKSATPISETTPLEYAFCRLDKIEGDGGQCTTSAVNKNTLKSKWEHVAQHFRGRPVSCSFICYR